MQPALPNEAPIRLTGLTLIYASLLACRADEGPFFIRGSARLSMCTESPAVNLDGTAWYDTGQLTIGTAGCGFDPGTVLDVCALRWEVAQTGNEVDILVDHEYRIRGRMCADQLHLEGGWWLPTKDDSGACSYQESDAAEVGIEEEGSTLIVRQEQILGSTLVMISGSLVVREACVAEYAITLLPHPHP